MEDKDFENGFIIMEEKKIKKVGNMSECPAECLKNTEKADIFDAEGLTIVPGFIDAHCHAGMWEDGIGFEGDDGNEDTDPATPQLRAIDAINPMEKTFSEALCAGVTSVVTGPGSANVIGGQMLAMKTFGRRVDDMVIKNPIAVKVAFGENPKSVYHGKNQSPSTRMATASILREYLFRAKEYLELIEKYEENPEENDKPEFDFKLHALIPVLKKEIPIHAHAHRCDDIFTAIRIAKEFEIKIALIHCTEGHLIAEELAAEKVPVMVGPSLSERCKIELRNLSFSTPSVLNKAGLSVAIITDHPVVPLRFLRLCADLASAEGMSMTDALRAITINPAKNVGIDNRVGSIKVGKDADIIIFDGNPIDIKTKIRKIYVDGRDVDILKLQKNISFV